MRINTGNRERLNYLNELVSVQRELLRPRMWWNRQYGITEIRELCIIIAQAREQLWNGVFAEFPHAIGKTATILLDGTLVIAEPEV